jgi:hypothetical protein
LLEPKGLGFFASHHTDGAPVIAVTATGIPYEVPLDVWARLVFEREGYEVVAAAWFPGPTGLFFDITGVRAGKPQPEEAAQNAPADADQATANTVHVRRSAIRAYAPEVISVNCLCALGHWEFAKEVFWAALATFKFTAPGPTRFESWVQVATTAPGFEFAHPASWLNEPVAQPPEGISAIDVRLPGEDDRLMAYLQVRAELLDGREPPTVEELEASELERLEGSGFVPAQASEPRPERDDPRAAAVAGWLGSFVVDGTLQDAPVTTLRGYLLRNEVVFTLLLISPRRDANPVVWLRALRAYEIARATLKPL